MDFRIGLRLSTINVTLDWARFLKQITKVSHKIKELIAILAIVVLPLKMEVNSCYKGIVLNSSLYLFNYVVHVLISPTTMTTKMVLDYEDYVGHQ